VITAVNEQASMMITQPQNMRQQPNAWPPMPIVPKTRDIIAVVLPICSGRW
jgi:hypothetical protein